MLSRKGASYGGGNTRPAAAIVVQQPGLQGNGRGCYRLIGAAPTTAGATDGVDGGLQSSVSTVKTSESSRDCATA